MSRTCNTRWWVLMHGRACGPVVVETTDDDRGPARRDGHMEVIDRLSAGLWSPARTRPHAAGPPSPVAGPKAR